MSDVIPPAGPMTEAEAWLVLDAYRFSRPRFATAVMTLIRAGVRKARIADAAGTTRPAITHVENRYRFPVPAGGSGATCGNVALPSGGQGCATVAEEVH